MRLLTTLAAALALSSIMSAHAVEAVRPAAVSTPAPSAAAVLRDSGLDRVFAAFGKSIADSPRQSGLDDERFLSAWERAITDAFGSGALTAKLETSIDLMLDPAELDGIGHFFISPFGLKIAALERQVQSGPADQRIAAIAKGQVLYLRCSPARRAQLEELLQLSGAEVTFAMLGESLRALAIGVHLAGGGELEVPWEEIDAAVTAELDGMEQSLAEASRGAVAYTYGELSDEELEVYLDFLRTPATRKFYSTAGVAIGAIIRETMFGLGEDVAMRLNRVDI